MELLIEINGFILLLLTVMGAVYWNDGIRWDKELENLIINEKNVPLEDLKSYDELLKYAEDARNKALLFFRILVCLGAIDIISLILAVFSNIEKWYKEIISIILILILFFLLIILIILIISPNFFVPIGYSNDLKRKKQNFFNNIL